VGTIFSGGSLRLRRAELASRTVFPHAARAHLAVAVSVAVGLALALAVPSASAESCPNERVRHESNLDPVTREPVSVKLPDCRAYELVTPAFKNGQNPTSLEPEVLDGSHIFYTDNGAFGGAPQDWAGGAGYLGTRDASGWATLPLDPPASTREGSLGGSPLNGSTPVADISQDFESDLFGISVASPVDLRVYLRRPAAADGSCSPGGSVVPGGACLVEVGPAFPRAAVEAWKPPEPFETTRSLEYVGASRDLTSRLVFDLPVDSETSRFRWPGDTTLENQSLYEYAGTGNSEPKLVGVENNGPLLSDAEAKPISQCGTYLGGIRTDAYNAVSASGEKVFFTAAAGGCTVGGEVGVGPPVGELYARVDGSRTVDISEPTTGPGGDCELCNTSAPVEGVFQGASEDGSKVFFLSEQANLLPGAEGMNLYEYDFNGPPHAKLVRISGGVSNPEAQGVARVSDDGSHVYFVAHAVLAGNEDAKKETAQAGQNNLYVYEPDPEHPGQYRTVFIATLAAEEDPESVWPRRDERQVQANQCTAAELHSACEPGRFLLFNSINDLTPDAAGEGSQLYRYDAAAGRYGTLVRVSIGQQAPSGYYCPKTERIEPGFNCNGNTPSSDGMVARQYVKQMFAGEWAVSMSDDGSYVFFTSVAGLTPQALNRVVVNPENGDKAQNVYEYHDGQVYLISDGQDRHTVFRGSAVTLFGASRSGGDVFFGTVDQLVGQDTDTQKDIYDARVDGGFPAPATPAPCTGEACAAAPGSAPLFATPPSSTFSGVGNLPAPPPTVVVQPKPKPKGLTRPQLLKRALRACQRKPKRKRNACVRQAHRRYGARSSARHHASKHAHGRAR
jgi:hypothetical protein